LSENATSPSQNVRSQPSRGNSRHHRFHRMATYSKDNPADAISRGQSPHAFLQNHTWFNGPYWLIKSENNWPIKGIETIEIPEIRKNVCLSTAHNNRDIFEKYSSYSKMLRIFAFCLRWRLVNRFRGLCAQEKSTKQRHDS